MTSDQLGYGDCGALLDEPILRILLDQTPWTFRSRTQREADLDRFQSSFGDLEWPTLVVERYKPPSAPPADPASRALAKIQQLGSAVRKIVDEVG